MDDKCYGCSYYDLTVIDIFPFEYCYKHDWKNIKPNDFCRCDDYTDSFLVKVKVCFKKIIS